MSASLGSCRKQAARRRREGWSSQGRRGFSQSGFMVAALMASSLSAVAQEQPEKLKILTPLYARPESDFWQHMVEAGNTTTVDYSVVINPNNGPGEAVDEEYTNGIYQLWDAGIEVLCYVATGFGNTSVDEVKADVDMYQSLYPDLCGGFFFDEGTSSEEYAWKYSEYYNHAQDVNDYATVVVNPGVTPDDALYHIADSYGQAGGQVVIVSFEHKFSEFYGTGKDVPSPPQRFTDRYMHALLVHAAYFKTLDEFLAETVFELYCANWGYVFFTDDSFGDDGNPWDQTPAYFYSLLAAVEAASEATQSCGTPGPTPPPTLVPTPAPLGPGETHPPVSTPAPTGTSPPAAIGETIAPVFIETPAPTPAPTKAPTAAPSRPPTTAPTGTPTAEPSTAPATPSPSTSAEDRDNSAAAGMRPSLGGIMATVVLTLVYFSGLYGGAWPL